MVTTRQGRSAMLGISATRLRPKTVVNSWPVEGWAGMGGISGRVPNPRVFASAGLVMESMAPRWDRAVDPSRWTGFQAVGSDWPFAIGLAGRQSVHRGLTSWKPGWSASSPPP